MNEQRFIERLLLERVQSQQALCGPVDVTTDLIDSGLLDSLLMLDLVIFLQSTFQIQIAPREIAPGNFRTVQTIAAWVAGHQKAA